MKKILFINLADEISGQQTLESFYNLPDTEYAAPSLFRLAQAFTVNEQRYIPPPLINILHKTYDLVIIESHGFLEKNDRCCSKFGEQADGLPIGNNIEFTPQQLARFLCALLPHHSLRNSARSIDVALAICYGARGLPWNIDHSDPSIDLHIIDSFAMRFLTEIRTLLSEKNFHLNKLTAFTGEISFSREISGAPLVQSEQSILTHFPRLKTLNTLLETLEENLTTAENEIETTNIERELGECLRQRDEVGRQILARRLNRAT